MASTGGAVTGLRAGVLLRVVALLAACVAGVGCEQPAPPGFERVTIGDRTFMLEIAADDATRFKGLTGRTEIAEDGGMLFVFPTASVRKFVMRDCLVPIDIVFIDPTGRVTATHQMDVFPRFEGESDLAYERRLSENSYSSRFAAQFAMEFAGGTLDALSIQPGQTIDLDVERLKALAR